MNLRPYLQFNRRISLPVSHWLVRTPFSPNFISFCGVLCAAFAAISLLAGSRPALLTGALWMHAALILDNCDGEVARLKGATSAFGRWWDSGCDVAVDALLWAGLYFAASASGRAVSPAWFWFAVAGSLFNFFLVIWERKSGCSSSIHDKSSVRAERMNSSFFSVLDTLAHNGDAALIIWLMAAIGNPVWFLVGAALYMNAMWLTRLAANWGKLLRFARPHIPIWIGRSAALAFGLWILFQVLRGVSWPELMALTGKAGWPVFLTLVIFPICTLFHTLSFRALYPSQTRSKMPLADLYWIKLTGEAFNKVSPFLDIAGDPAKALLMEKRGLARMEESVAALAAFRISYVLSEVLLVLAGLGMVSFFHFSAPLLMWGAVAVLISVVYIFLIVRSLKRFAGVGVSRRVSELLRFSKGDLWKAIFWNELGWVFLFFEAFVVLRLLGVSIGAVHTFVVQSLLQAVQTLTFFVPAHIGTQEGGLAFLMAYLHYSPASGVALSLIKRARQLFWALLAIPLYYRLRDQRPALSLTTSSPTLITPE